MILCRLNSICLRSTFLDIVKKRIGMYLIDSSRFLRGRPRHDAPWPKGTAHRLWGHKCCGVWKSYSPPAWDCVRMSVCFHGNQEGSGSRRPTPLAGGVPGVVMGSPGRRVLPGPAPGPIRPLVPQTQNLKILGLYSRLIPTVTWLFSLEFFKMPLEMNSAYLSLLPSGNVQEAHHWGLLTTRVSYCHQHIDRNWVHFHQPRAL